MLWDCRRCGLDARTQEFRRVSLRALCPEISSFSVISLSTLISQLFDYFLLATYSQVPTNDINVLSVLSYAIDHLQVDRIVIAGHTHCGGVKYCYTQAASLPKPAPNPLPPLPDPILNTWLANLYTLAVQLLDSGSNQYDNSADADADQQAAMEELTLENIKMQVQNVASLDMVKDAWKQGRDLRVVGWLYQLETGRLKDLGICVGPLCTVGCEL